MRTNPQEYVDEVPSRLMPEDKADLLSSYNFINMYISKDPLSPIMAHGLRSATIGLSAFGKGLVRIPDILVEDAFRLFEVVDRMWKNSGYKREFSVSYDGRSYRCALIAAPEANFDDRREASRAHEIRWCIRQVSQRPPSFEDLSLPEDVRGSIEELLVRRGLVICSGPFSSGKTTLASSVLDHWVATSRDVGITLEDPPEIPLARVTQDRGVIYQIDLQDRSVRDAIKNARRWSPRYVFLGEVRSSDVAGELLHMSISGPLTICTIHSSDPVQAIVSLFRFASASMSEDMALDMIAASLLHVFHQEIIAGRVIMKQAQIQGAENHLIRAKIKSGNFRGLYEDFERQLINRN
ncbi:type IV pilus twitching motility protein PilT [Epibacterium sp. DP7N7-1]|nr:type IV pilus twitching motility protein PilT [Epibacterium sp. DP7N7-1]